MVLSCCKVPASWSLGSGLAVIWGRQDLTPRTAHFNRPYTLLTTIPSFYVKCHKCHIYSGTVHLRVLFEPVKKNSDCCVWQKMDKCGALHRVAEKIVPALASQTWLYKGIKQWKMNCLASPKSENVPLSCHSNQCAGWEEQRAETLKSKMVTFFNRLLKENGWKKKKLGSLPWEGVQAVLETPGLLGDSTIECHLNGVIF